MANAKALGLDLSTVIRMVVNRLAVNAELPIDLLQPNQETLQAIRDLETGWRFTVLTRWMRSNVILVGNNADNCLSEPL